VNQGQKYRLFSSLYLLSFAVLAGWFVLLLVGLVWPTAMRLANQIALPTLLGSIVCLETFRRLAARSRKKVTA
jgi:hypothetical protein